MAQSLMPRHRQRFPALDLIRLLAATLVVFYHLAWFLAPHPLAMFSFGWVGVEIFFVISGFVIAFSAEKHALRPFVASRATRIYPVAIIASTVIVVVQLARGFPPLAEATLFLKSALLVPIGPWLDNVFWTLPIEMVFYALVATGIARRWRLDVVALALGGYSAGYWAMVLLADRLGGVALPDLSTGKYALSLLHYGVFFALGMLLYARRHGVVAGVLFVAGIAAVTERSLGHGGAGAPLWAAPLAFTVAIALIEGSVRANARLQSLNTRALGLMTYPLYLIHSVVGVAFFGLVPFAYALPLGVALAFAAAWAMLPLEAALRRLLLAAWRGAGAAIQRPAIAGSVVVTR